MKLLLVDDHPLFLEGLKFLLQSYGIDVLDTVNDGRQSIEKARLLKPDLILMDIQMPGLGGLDALKLIKAQMPDIKVVMLTASEEESDLFEAIKCGASGYLIKNTNAEELVNMLMALEEGEVVLSAGLAEQLLQEFGTFPADKEPALPDSIDALSAKQLEVLELVAKGYNYKEVGDRMNLKERTVKYHMGKIIETLQLKNRNQVIAYASKIGLFENKK